MIRFRRCGFPSYSLALSSRADRAASGRQANARSARSAAVTPRMPWTPDDYVSVRKRISGNSYHDVEQTVIMLTICGRVLDKTQVIGSSRQILDMKPLVRPRKRATAPKSGPSRIAHEGLSFAVVLSSLESEEKDASDLPDIPLRFRRVIH